MCFDVVCCNDCNALCFTSLQKWKTWELKLNIVSLQWFHTSYQYICPQELNKPSTDFLCNLKVQAGVHHCAVQLSLIKPPSLTSHASWKFVQSWTRKCGQAVWMICWRPDPRPERAGLRNTVCPISPSWNKVTSHEGTVPTSLFSLVQARWKCPSMPNSFVPR